MLLFYGIRRRVDLYTGPNVSEEPTATLKMEIADFFEALVNMYPTTWHHGYRYERKCVG
jgi:hypothetical protein